MLANPWDLIEKKIGIKLAPVPKPEPPHPKPKEDLLQQLAHRWCVKGDNFDDVISKVEQEIERWFPATGRVITATSVNLICDLMTQIKPLPLTVFYVPPTVRAWCVVERADYEQLYYEQLFTLLEVNAWTDWFSVFPNKHVWAKTHSTELYQRDSLTLVVFRLKTGGLTTPAEPASLTTKHGAEMQMLGPFHDDIFTIFGKVEGEKGCL